MCVGVRAYVCAWVCERMCVGGCECGCASMCVWMCGYSYGWLPVDRVDRPAFEGLVRAHTDVLYDCLRALLLPAGLQRSAGASAESPAALGGFREHAKSA